MDRAAFLDARGVLGLARLPKQYGQVFLARKVFDQPGGHVDPLHDREALLRPVAGEYCTNRGMDPEALGFKVVFERCRAWGVPVEA